MRSAIPTLSFGGLFDIQTPASWAKAATEKLSNAQAFVIPEAGHGALIYQPCVAEMGVAFIDNPKRQFDDTCAKASRSTGTSRRGSPRRRNEPANCLRVCLSCRA